MILSHNLGFPRIGEKRELKKATEAYWKGKLSLKELHAKAKEIHIENLKKQQAAGVDIIPTFDFSLYDHILSTSMLLGVIPERFQSSLRTHPLEDVMFEIARGKQGEGNNKQASELTKWFDTNYHYIVPELDAVSSFPITDRTLFQQTEEALKLEIKAKPVLVGPVTYLYLSKFYTGENTLERKLKLLPQLLTSYETILSELHALGVEWIQLDEPIFALDLEPILISEVEKSFKRLYAKLESLNQTRPEAPTKLLIATYFNDLGSQLHRFFTLAADAFHIDLSRTAPSEDANIIQAFTPYAKRKTLSLGIINGRNIWRNDLNASYNRLKPFTENIPNLFIAPSCSLIHSPITLRHEGKFSDELRSLFSFAEEKLTELKILTSALKTGDKAKILTHPPSPPDRTLEEVQTRLNAITEADFNRKSPFAVRKQVQNQTLGLPLFPTTTIGSFPQTPEIRKARNQFKKGLINEKEYQTFLETEIKWLIEKQEALDIDVFVHGEPERNDMVEYFADKLTGYAFSEYGWVQSYGSRYVKPPIIYGDVKRKHPMTVSWSQYAQSLTPKHVKGMLTGPITMLQWSFVREDQPRATTTLQLALALQDEVQDLEAAGIKIIQIDEPAIREGLPLRKAKWKDYLDWAVKSFRLCSAKVKDETQIQTHMCYSYFSDIIDAIVALDSDVILIESSRSKMGLLRTLTDFNYPAFIGPGLYDIHSPRIPTTDEMYALLEKALEVIEKDMLWVNPDCGLKTREWAETEHSLKNLVASAKKLRTQYA